MLKNPAQNDDMPDFFIISIKLHPKLIVDDNNFGVLAFHHGFAPQHSQAAADSAGTVTVITLVGFCCARSFGIHALGSLRSSYISRSPKGFIKIRLNLIHTDDDIDFIVFKYQ